MNSKCSGCGKESQLLSEQGECLRCSMFVVNGGPKIEIFEETFTLTGHDSYLQFDFPPEWPFSDHKPKCYKCQKEVDIFGPMYFVEYACSRTYFASCHGKVQFSLITEIICNKDRTRKIPENLKEFFR